LFEAKDLIKIFGLKPETIFLWLRTYNIFEPTERARGVRGKNKYSFIDLIKLDLIARLQTLGIHLSRIRQIFVELDRVHKGKSLWDLIVNERTRIDRNGAILFIDRTRLAEFNMYGELRNPPRYKYFVSIYTYAGAMRRFKANIKILDTFLIVNINSILKGMGPRIDFKLGPKEKLQKNQIQ